MISLQGFNNPTVMRSGTSEQMNHLTAAECRLMPIICTDLNKSKHSKSTTCEFALKAVFYI